MRAAALLMAAMAAAPAQAGDALGNLRFTLFHELGHAVIDQYEVALFGPEEIAADGFGLLLGDRLLTTEESDAMMRAVISQARAWALPRAPTWSDYLPDGQRLAWKLCVWYGLDPDAHGPLARALGMPSDREDRCAEAGDHVARAWKPILAGIEAGPGPALTRLGDGKALRMLEGDMATVNAAISLPRPVSVEVEPCGEDNAFYYPLEERIVFCAELTDALLGR
jgi:hypothetical protein